MTPQTKTHSIRALRSSVSFVRCRPEELNGIVSRETGIPDSFTTDTFGRSGAAFTRDCADGRRRHFVAFHAPVESMPLPKAGALAAHLCLHTAMDALFDRGIGLHDEIIAHAVQEIMEACLEFIEEIRGKGDGTVDGEGDQDWWPCCVEEGSPLPCGEGA